MNLNDDCSTRVVARSADAARSTSSSPSPQPGVERRPLDRVGGEVARATSLVRDAPESHFDRPVHGAGEEILVLDGVFSDQALDGPAGTWLRSPRWRRPAPFTGAQVALIEVKLGHLGAANPAR